MTRCKKCGYEAVGIGTRCSECGARLELTRSAVCDQLALLSRAIKDKHYDVAHRGYLALAEDGYVDAEREYAKLCEAGKLVPCDKELAAKYYFSAAKKNDPYSAYRYSHLIKDKDPQAARFWLLFSAMIGCVDSYPDTARDFSECGYEEEAQYFYYLAAMSDDTESIVTLAKRYHGGVLGEVRDDYAKWWLKRLRFPPLYALRLVYNVREATPTEPPAPELKNPDGLIRSLIAEADSIGAHTAYFKLVEMLSDNGDTHAEAMLGEALVLGKGCTPDVERAVKILTRSAAHGQREAFVTLGNLYLDGKVTAKNIPLAIDYYRRAGERGSADSYKLIADVYFGGVGVERNIPEALKYYTLAGKGGIEIARLKAEEIIRDREAIYRTAKEKEEDEPEEAFRLYAISCAMGHSGATLKLADCYAKGVGTKINRHGAFIWYKKAMEAGEEKAVFPLAVCYAGGIGINRDFKKARELLIRADRLGERRAERLLVDMLKRKAGKLSGGFYSAAMRLIYAGKIRAAVSNLEIAAELGHAKSIYTLGCMYEFGMGVECNKEEAYALYEKSFALLFRDPRARYKLKVLKMLKGSF
ncbi:MAG: SEL1-like repeat protein [Clostridia bacterium]|nr:SEL1-like repeat protein [Clostridia bacterium]